MSCDAGFLPVTFYIQNNKYIIKLSIIQLTIANVRFVMKFSRRFFSFNVGMIIISSLPIKATEFHANSRSKNPRLRLRIYNDWILVHLILASTYLKQNPMAELNFFSYLPDRTSDSTQL